MTWFGFNEFLGSLVLNTNVSTLFIVHDMIWSTNVAPPYCLTLSDLFERWVFKCNDFTGSPEQISVHLISESWHHRNALLWKIFDYWFYSVTHWAFSSPQNYFIPLHRARGEGSACSTYSCGWMDYLLYSLSFRFLLCNSWVCMNVWTWMDVCVRSTLGNCFRFVYDM